MSDDLTKEHREELEKLQKEIIDEAKKLWKTMLITQVIFQVVLLTYIRTAHT